MKIETINKVLNKMVVAIITEKSLVVIDLYGLIPNPGTPKIFSIVNVPVRIPANIGTIIVIIGIRAFLNACPNSTRMDEFPFALANNM